jgi:hypothetical protein
MPTPLYNALIRTHHITSRKKVAALKAAAKRLNVQTLLRSGGVPGVMYVEGSSYEAVQDWVNIVHGLRYKDYELAVGVQSMDGQAPEKPGQNCGSEARPGELAEVHSVKDMGAWMEERGLSDWWRAGMGFTKNG